MLPSDKPVRRLGAFAFLAAFCEALGFYAASLYAYELTHSIIAVSIVMTAIAIAETIGAVLGGTVADRLDRKLVALLGALAGSMLLAVLVFGADVPLLIGVMSLATIATSPIRPVVGAALPNLVVEGDLAFANSYVQGLRNAALTLAPVAAGLGVGIIGARGIFGIAAGSLLAATAVLVFVRGEFHATPVAGRVSEISDSPFEGLAFLRRDRVLLTIVGAGALSFFTAAYCMIADLPLALDDLGAGQVGYGILVASWGVGTTAGAVLSPAVLRRFGAPRAFAAAMVLEGVVIASIAAIPTLTLVCVTFLIGGVFGGIGVVADQIVVQERVPDEARGRVRATNDAVLAASYALSLGIGGFVVELLGARGTYLLGGGGVLLAGLLAITALRTQPGAATTPA
jgi:MFS family permease